MYFFSFYSSVVCVLPMVTWSTAPRSSQELASNLKAYIWEEGSKLYNLTGDLCCFILCSFSQSGGFFGPFRFKMFCQSASTIPQHCLFCIFIFYTLHLWHVQFFSARNYFNWSSLITFNLLSVCCCQSCMSDLVFIRLIKTVWLWICLVCRVFMLHVFETVVDNY